MCHINTVWVVHFLCILIFHTSAIQYTHDWAIEVDGGQEEADLVAKDTGCVNQGLVIEKTYLLKCHHVRTRSTEPHTAVHSELSSHPFVKLADQQIVKSRQKRQLWRLPQQPVMQPTEFEDLAHFNDERWGQMWYLNRGHRLDMNVQDAWLQGATGEGISVTILDDGIEKSHPDIVANYDPLASYDVNQNDNDPTPRYDLIDSNRHGTRCAGEVAATANNSNCAVGIAYKSGIGGVRMLDGDVTDAVEARSLGLNAQHIHIYSASWGPDDDGKTVDGPGRLATRAFLQGISQGRNGKGSIFVWASGNGGRDYDNCNCDGYTNSIWTLSVSSATENGLIPWYSEACSSTLATTYSSGSSGERKVVTTDLHHTCTSTHTGTSASAPMAAGVIALILQVNPDLNWRDVQHVTVRCAHNANLKANDWSTNAIGRNYSHSFGYGLMDAGCMVRLAKQWKSVPEQKKCSVQWDHPGTLSIQGKSSQTSIIHVKGCDDVDFLEHVQAHVTLAASKRGDVEISLTSPKGTKSLLIAKRPKDYSRAGFTDWPFLTVHMWEESPVGDWTLEIKNDGRQRVDLTKWSISFYGTKEHPQPGGTPNEEPRTNNNNNSIVNNSPADIAPAEVDLNQVPEDPVQQTADVSPPSRPHHIDANNDLKEPEPAVNPQKFLENMKNKLKNNPRLENCQDAANSEWCSVCKSGFKSIDGRCVESCPSEGYYTGQENNQDACIQCYYTCKTCDGPNDYQCTECYGDANLDEESPTHKYCHNKSLIDRVDSSTKWYYVLTIGFLVNFFIIAFLVVYIINWRRKHHMGNMISSDRSINTSSSVMSNGLGARKKSWNGVVSSNHANNNRGYSPVKSSGADKSLTTVPFHDYDSSSDEELYNNP